jgi:endonuclease/exonuclease/phosphatase family metal-dependent hydrolase
VNRLKLLTLNIWNRQGPWERRLELIRAGIAALDPDVVGLQEVLRLEGTPPDQAEAIAAGLGYQVAYGPAWAIWGGSLYLGNAVLSRWPIVEIRNWPLPTLHEDETRALLLALVDAPVGRIPVLCTHLSWRFHAAEERALQVRAVDERAREVAATRGGFPPILMGDFNAEPDSDEIRFLRGLTALGGRSTYWADCFGLAGDGPGHTFARVNGYAAPLREPSRRIDYIFSRGPDRQLRGEPLTARVVLDQPDGDVFPSDHFGVYAETSA